MIVGTIQNGAMTVVLVGLSDENIKRMKEGKPVRVTKEHPAGDALPGGYELCILHGSTEMAILHQLREAGLVTEETVVNKDPRL
jgi:hypothetical protein